jgi:hypothetical protein
MTYGGRSSISEVIGENECFVISSDQEVNPLYTISHLPLRQKLYEGEKPTLSPFVVV